MYQIHNMEEVHFSPSNSKTRYLWHYQNSLLCTLSRFHRWFCSVLSHINLPGIDMVDQNATFFNKKTPRSHFFLWASIRKTPSLTSSCWPHFCQRPRAAACCCAWCTAWTGTDTAHELLHAPRKSTGNSAWADLTSGARCCMVEEQGGAREVTSHKRGPAG